MDGYSEGKIIEISNFIFPQALKILISRGTILDQAPDREDRVKILTKLKLSRCRVEYTGISGIFSNGIQASKMKLIYTILNR